MHTSRQTQNGFRSLWVLFEPPLTRKKRIQMHRIGLIAKNIDIDISSEKHYKQCDLKNSIVIHAGKQLQCERKLDLNQP